jgi:ribosomal-protein-alanine N-acetyltransferase
MSSTFTITPFKLGDLKAVLGLEQEIFPEDTYGMVEFLSLYVRSKDSFFVARQDKTLVGYAVGYLDEGEGYVVSIGVDPDVRGQGLGRLLMQTLMDWLYSHGAKVIGLHVRADNQPAIHLYEALGFSIQGTVQNYYEDGSPALVMER